MAIAGEGAIVGTRLRRKVMTLRCSATFQQLLTASGRPRAVHWEKGGTSDNTSRNEICPLFALVKLVPPLHKLKSTQLNLSNRNR
jgi:hypothetical protein